MSRALENTSRGMLLIVIIGFVTFVVNIVMMSGMGFGGAAVIGLLLPIFYLITLILKKQRAFAIAILVLSILGIISSISSLSLYAASWALYTGMYSLMPVIMVLCVAILVCNIYLLINVNKLRKEPKY